MRTQPFLGEPGDHATARGGALTESQLIAEMGRLYYLEDVSKVKLGKMFDLSRFKIARMLAKGREEGTIRIEINEPTMNLPELAEPLKATLGLPLVRVVESRGTPSQVRDAVGAMGAQLMREALEPGDLIGVGWGKTVLSVASQYVDPPELTVVQLSGVVPSSTPASPIERLRAQVENIGGAVHAISAPLFAGSAQRRDSWVAGLGPTRNLYEKLDLAVVGIGAWQPLATELHRVFPPSVKEKLDAVEPIAEILGHWFTAEGGVVATDVTRMCVTTEVHHLSAAPHVLAVASGAEKARAILGVARSGLITGLITDREAAEAMMRIASEG